MTLSFSVGGQLERAITRWGLTYHHRQLMLDSSFDALILSMIVFGFMNAKVIAPSNSRWFVGWLFLIFLCGCGGKNDAAKDSTARLHPEIQSTAELRRRLIPGMVTNEILASFGEPVWAETRGEGWTEWRYGLSSFPADDDMRGTFVVGVTIEITNGRLARSSCTYMAPPTGGDAKVVPLGRSNEGPLGGPQESPVLKVFVVSDEPLADGQQIDTAEFPKLGFISGTPNLVFKRLKELSLGENAMPQPDNKISTTWQFGICLTPEDAARFASLTASNVSRKVLITVGDVPLIAPRISEPLESGSFVITCSEQSLMELVRSNLSRMEQQTQ